MGLGTTNATINTRDIGRFGVEPSRHAYMLMAAVTFE